MRSTELHGERRSWNHHLVRWVVRFRRIFLEVRVFRDVRDEFHDLVAHHLATAAAVRENGITHQDHAGAWLVLVANLVDSRMLHQLSRSQKTIGLVKGCSVSRFHASLCCVPSWGLGRRAGLRASRPSQMGCVLSRPKLVRSRHRARRLLFYFQATRIELRAQAFLVQPQIGA
jgi:hypothetical protein